MSKNNDDYPASYQDQPLNIQKKAAGIANALLKEGSPKEVAFAIGLKLAREYFDKKEEQDNLSKLSDNHK